MPRLSGVGRAARYRAKSKAVDNEQTLESQNKETESALPPPTLRLEEGVSETISFSTFRPDREGVRKVLGDLEADVMEYIWDQPDNSQGITVREVFEALQQSRPIAYTTVMNTMSRLAHKQLLNVRKEETAFFYSPKLSQTEFIEVFIGRILDDLLVSFGQTTREQIEKRIDKSERERLNELKQRLEDLRSSE